MLVQLDLDSETNFSVKKKTNNNYSLIIGEWLGSSKVTLQNYKLKVGSHHNNINLDSLKSLAEIY